MPRRLSPQLRYDAAARTVTGVLLPFGVVTPAKDAVTGRMVQERVLPGAMRLPDEAPTLTLMHIDQHVAALAVELHETPDALELTALLDGPDADLAIRMLSRGTLSGLSAEFVDLERVDVAGVSEVRLADLTGTSLVDRGAYRAARPQLRELRGLRAGAGNRRLLEVLRWL